MRESELHQRIFTRSADLSAAFSSVEVGPGDDCAVVRTRGGNRLLLKVDQVVERRHFLSSTRVHLIARKAIARAVSDIAAMGGSTSGGWSLASGILPPQYPYADDLCARLAEWARHWDTPLVGGDIATGPPGSMLSLSITTIGVPHPHRGPVLRSTALPGDELWVTGRIGNSFQSEHHLNFEPRLAEARLLCDTLGTNLTSMIDISDGLGRDAGRLAAASKVHIAIDAEAIPLAPGAKDPVEEAARGEDYELLFTTRPGSFAPPANAPVPFTRIGRVEHGSVCTLSLPSGEHIDATSLGWDH